MVHSHEWPLISGFSLLHYDAKDRTTPVIGANVLYSPLILLVRAIKGERLPMVPGNLLYIIKQATLGGSHFSTYKYQICFLVSGKLCLVVFALRVRPPFALNQPRAYGVLSNNTVPRSTSIYLPNAVLSLLRVTFVEPVYVECGMPSFERDLEAMPTSGALATLSRKDASPYLARFVCTRTSSISVYSTKTCTRSALLFHYGGSTHSSWQQCTHQSIVYTDLNS